MRQSYNGCFYKQDNKIRSEVNDGTYFGDFHDSNDDNNGFYNKIVLLLIQQLLKVLLKLFCLLLLCFPYFLLYLSRLPTIAKTRNQFIVFVRKY